MHSSGQTYTSGQFNSQDYSAPWCPLFGCGGIPRWERVDPCSAGVHRADVRCEILQTLWTCKNCSLTSMLLWLTVECTHA